MLNEEIKVLKKKIDEMEWLKRKVQELETVLADIKNKKVQEQFKCKKCQKIFESDDSLKNHLTLNHSNRVKCKLCAKDFSKNNHLEVHIKTEHQEVEKIKCEICDMTFVLEWRLKKHKNIHSEKAVNFKFCHYYNNNKTCPYSDLGCMFRHEDSPICLSKTKCSNNLCQFKHSPTDKKKQHSCDTCNYITDSAEDFKMHMEESHTTKSNQKTDDKQIFDLYVKTNFPEVFDSFLTNQNQITCYFCDYVSKNQGLKNIKNEITGHMETDHEEIIEVFKSDNTEVENILHLEFLEFFIPE